MNPEGSRFAAGTEHTAKSYEKDRTAVQYGERARQIHRQELDARPGRFRIQVSEVQYIRSAVNVPDASMFLTLI